MTRAYVGLGSNLGDRTAVLASALAELGRTPGITVAGVSSAYESEPWGGVEQPAYANAVAALDVELDPAGLLAACKRIEQDLGRVPGIRFGPRAIDLDVLLFGSERVETPDLVVPHLRMLEREFVVTPLLELAPEVTLPDGSSITRERAVEGRIVRRLGVIARAGEPGPPLP